MKKAIFFLVLFIASVFYIKAAHPVKNNKNKSVELDRSKFPDIKGIGVLRLGDSISKVESIYRSMKKDTLSNFSSYFANESNSNSIYYELLPDTTLESDFFIASLSKDVRVLFFPKIKIFDDIVLRKAKLKFFKHKLFSIISDGDLELEEAITAKYGEPFQSKSYNSKKNETVFNTNWLTRSKFIVCSSVLSETINDSYEKEISFRFFLFDTSYDDEIELSEKKFKSYYEKLNRELTEHKYKSF